MRCGLGVLALVAVAAVAGLGEVAGARADVVFEPPVPTITDGTVPIELGVWYQPGGGTRRYRMTIETRRGRVVWSRTGYAGARWRFWACWFGEPGLFNVIYSAGRKDNVLTHVHSVAVAEGGLTERYRVVSCSVEPG
jgi:hypothetical protein